MKSISILLFAFLAFSSSIFGQEAPNLIKANEVIVPVLVFENLEKRDIKFVRETGKIQYALRSRPKTKIVGILEKVKPNSMIVNGKEIQFADCEYIKGRVRSDKDMVGGMLVGAGVSALAFGGVFISTAPGVAIVAVGAAALGSGIALVSNQKKFNFNKGWTVQGGEIRYQR